MKTVPVHVDTSKEVGDGYVIHEHEQELDALPDIFVTCAPDSPSADFGSQALSQELTEGAGHATGQASFEAETNNQSRRRDGAGCYRTGSFAD